MNKGLDKLIVYLQAPWKRRSFATKSFPFDGQQLQYAAHSYNATWRNERAIEVPVLIDFLQRHKGKKILELGNVARYYGDFSHEVVDKYEQHPAVYNFDILDFKVDQPYHAFVSISTLEHIGWDEPVRDHSKISRVFEKLPDLVSNLDNVLFSFPTGYNSVLDQHLAKDELPFQKLLYFKRCNRANHWQPTCREEALGLRYDSRFPAANGLAFGIGLKY